MKGMIFSGIMSALIAFSLFSCATASVPVVDTNHFSDGTDIVTSEDFFTSSENRIFIAFAGDIMAHTENISGDFKNIYSDIAPFLKKNDFALANLETPVNNKIGYSTYPRFCIKEEYALASIDAGFNVFSLTNNHTDDQEILGMQTTRDFFKKLESENDARERKIYATGIKDKKNDPLTYRILEKNGWKILFVSVSEISNTLRHTEYYDYVKPTAKEREKFLGEIHELREKTNPDIFILGFHCNEEEYVLTVAENQKKFYHQIIDSGVDVLWINHAHVPKEWEVFSDRSTGCEKLIFYGMGNTISGQRRNPRFKNPSRNLEYTGDGLLTQVAFEKKEGKVHLSLVNPMIITTYITMEKQYVIRILNEQLIEELKMQDRKEWSDYLAERKKLMEKIKGKLTWE